MRDFQLDLPRPYEWDVDLNTVDAQVTALRFSPEHRFSRSFNRQVAIRFKTTFAVSIATPA